MSPEKRISVRVDADLKLRIKRLEEQTGLTEAALVKECVKAFLEEFDRTGQVTLPIKITSESLKKGVRPPYSQSEQERLKVAEGS